MSYGSVCRSSKYHSASSQQQQVVTVAGNSAVCIHDSNSSCRGVWVHKGTAVVGSTPIPAMH
jgi:hypothetical protein